VGLAIAAINAAAASARKGFPKPASSRRIGKTTMRKERLMRPFSVPAAALMLAFGAHAAFAQVQGEWTSAGTMQSPRESDAEVVLTNGSVLAIGGIDNTGAVLASAEIYSPSTNSWGPTSSMAAARQLFDAVVLTNGNVLVIGGLGTGGAVLRTAELYNSATRTWSAAGSLSVARFDHSATLLKDGRVLVTGGCPVSGCSVATGVSEFYDPATNTWSTTGALKTARRSHNAVRLNDGRVLAIGGSTGAATTSCELYNPSTGAWSVAASTNTPRLLNSASLLPSGKALVTGGVITRFPLNSAELYDPKANTWTLTGNMTVGRYAHGATPLPDGTVLVSGGIGQPTSCGKICVSYIPTAKAEIYNEASGTFAPAAPLNRPLAYHSATLLKSGRALANGGSSTTSTCCVVVADAEAYTPLTLTFSSTTLNFGLLQIGLTSASQTVTVNNVSSHPTVFTGIAASGDYEETNSCPATLNQGQQCAISVAFKPTAAGTRSGAITLRDNSPGSPRQTIALYGTGVKLALGFTPVSVNAGSVAVGSSVTAIAMLTNDGAAPVAISGIAIAPADGTFTQTNTCPASLAVQRTCTIQVVFMPPDVFTYNATLSVTNNAGAPATLPLLGTGLDGS
jgi:N-acetylneuraminic acid mutarotase